MRLNRGLTILVSKLKPKHYFHNLASRIIQKQVLSSLKSFSVLPMLKKDSLDLLQLTYMPTLIQPSPLTYRLKCCLYVWMTQRFYYKHKFTSQTHRFTVISKWRVNYFCPGQCSFPFQNIMESRHMTHTAHSQTQTHTSAH